jgi:hypothetical protein
MNRTPLFPLLVTALFSIAGCGAPGGDTGDDLADDGDNVAEAEAALCSDPVVASSYFNMATAVSAQGAAMSYGTAACPGRYVVDFNNTAGKNVSLYAKWGDTAPTSTTCAASSVTARVYGHVPNGLEHPGYWTPIAADVTLWGTWTQTGCALFSNLQGVTASPYDSLRVAASASQLAPFATMKGVKVGAYITGVGNPLP